MKDVFPRLKSDMPINIDRNLLMCAMAQKDISSAYVSWLNDDEVAQYTEPRF